MWDVLLVLCLFSCTNSLTVTPKWTDFKAIEFGEIVCTGTSCESGTHNKSDESIQKVKVIENPVDELGSEFLITNEDITSFRDFGYEDSEVREDVLRSEHTFEGSGNTGQLDITEEPIDVGDNSGSGINRTVLIISIVAIGVSVVAVIGVIIGVYYIRSRLRIMRDEQTEYLRDLDASAFENSVSIPRVFSPRRI